MEPTTPNEIITTIKLLKPKASSGYDEISVKFIQSCSLNSLAKPLSHIINTSFQTGIFPTNMKLSKVIPIYKSNDPQHFKNYRPISLLPAFSKIIEKIVYKRLFRFISLHNILSPSQYGFQENLSTQLAILELQNKIVKAMNDNKSCIGLFIDLAKAFDTLNHSILLEKLCNYGIRGLSLQWFRSYLQDRYQFVKYKNVNSEHEQVTCGVPQGSILGPLLFLLYINDVMHINNSHHIILFADDTNCLFTGNNIEDLVQQINSSIRNLSEWFRTNKLSLNIDKSNYVIFHKKQSSSITNNHTIKIDDKELSQVNHVKFLGVLLDANMTWNIHLTQKANKIAKVNGILCRLKHYLPSYILKTIYDTLILPHLYYSITAWGNLKTRTTKRIIILQKKVHSYNFKC